MTDRIILSITHSDPYTDYLFQTCWLRNPRVIPLVDPSDEDLGPYRQSGTIILHCVGSRREPAPGDETVMEVDWTTRSRQKRTIMVLSRRYLGSGGDINPTAAELARARMKGILENILLADRNLQEVYRHYFPLLWGKRQHVYDDPNLFYVPAGQVNPRDSGFYPLGVMLRSIDEGGESFRFRHADACRCGCGPILMNYNINHGDWFNTSWKLHTWCPGCGQRREFNTGYFPGQGEYDRILNETAGRYDRDGWRSRRNIFDVIDSLSK